MLQQKKHVYAFIWIEKEKEGKKMRKKVILSNY